MPDDDLNSGAHPLPASAGQKFDVVCKLLEEVTSLGVLSEFLKAKELSFSSGSWEHMKTKRLRPYLQEGKITLDELVGILNEQEEYGRGHTFLFQGTPEMAVTAMDRSHLEDVCQARGITSALTGTGVENLPQVLTLAQIRQEQKDDHQILVMKFVETRIEKDYLGENFAENILTKSWEYRSVRAVNVVRLHGSGLLEIRIHSHTNTSKYDNDVHAIKMQIRHFLPIDRFAAVSLRRARNRFLEEKESLAEHIRFADATLRNTLGNKFSASTGPVTGDLYTDKPFADGMAALLRGQGVNCESSGIAWKAAEGRLSREVKMLISGLNNEFAITTDCTKVEYEHVLNELRRYNTDSGR